ncbi:MAG: Gfo/Idh/MocA family oxidoreductase [Sedimentisphaerales bacterium]|nr:Gfo/Idh/MocA family oxidoreductase [Sedimentisphaerales bacterium]
MLKGGVVGFGRMGLVHFSILNTHPDVDLIAVCDSSSFVLKNAAEHMGVETFKNFERMFQTMDLDFVVVATPTSMHADVTECAISHNTHVFVEKPLTLNPEQSRRLLELVQGKQLVHQVGYAMRFHDIFMKAKSLIDIGAIGRIVTFTVEMNGPVVLHEARKSWRSNKTEGGGCLYDFASHSVDLVNYLVGPPDEVVGTVFNRIHSNGVEDAISSTFIYGNGTRGNLLANWSDPSYRKPSCRFEAMGTKGKIIADFYTYKVFFREAPEIDGYTQGWNEGYLADTAEPVRFYVRGFQFTRQLDVFIDCILEQRACETCSFEEALCTDMIMHRIRTDGEIRRTHDRQNYLRRQPVLRH